jgi:hypothetical protein
MGKISDLVGKVEDRMASDPKTVKIGLTDRGRAEVHMHDEGMEGAVFRYLDARGAATLSDVAQSVNLSVGQVRAIAKPYTKGMSPLIQVS